MASLGYWSNRQVISQTNATHTLILTSHDRHIVSSHEAINRLSMLRKEEDIKGSIMWKAFPGQDHIKWQNILMSCIHWKTHALIESNQPINRKYIYSLPKLSNFQIHILMTSKCVCSLFSFLINPSVPWYIFCKYSQNRWCKNVEVARFRVKWSYRSKFDKCLKTLQRDGTLFDAYVATLLNE